MNRKTLIALGAFVVLGLIAIVALRQPEKGERAGDHPRPLPALSPPQITTLEVTKGGVTTTLKNEGGVYKVTAPVNYPADSGNAKSAFEGLGKIDVTDLVTSQPDKQAEFEVDDKTCVRLVAKHDGQVLADFVVGKSMGSGTMVRLSGSNDVWRASGISKFTYDKGPVEWRDKSITTFTAGDAEKLDIVDGKDGAKISLKKTGTKQGSEDKWEVTDSSVKIDKLDNSVPNGIVSALSAWKANDFADGMTANQAALDARALNITVGLKGGQSVAVRVGGKQGDDTYVKKTDAPQMFLVKKFNLDRVAKRPVEFRDKTLCDIAADDLGEISVSAGDKSFTLTKSGSDWKATKPKLDLDGSKATPIAGAFKDLKAASYAEDQSLKDNGLAKPKVITAKSKDGKQSCLVHVGDESKDKVNYVVTKGKETDVLLAPKWALDRILVKPDDLKKTGGTTTAAAKPAKPAAGRVAAKK
ncbi:MAG TPA: DUF4340 domain-containing protein [Polyangia bacterium]|nr:DUF4340 domain-containing protein [Polyangia bacterium]